MTRRYNKYRAKKVSIDGNSFDSKREAKRYTELKLLLRAGKIKNLERQKEFVLIPTQREKSEEIYKRGAHRGEAKKGKIIERGVSYFADFCYNDESGNYIVEDTKGVRTKEYIIKRKLMYYIHGIRIKEI